MIEEKFKTLESNVFNLLEQNKSLKVELELLTESLSQCMKESAESMNALQIESAKKLELLQSESAQALSTLQTESAQALETLREENTLLQSRNAELTMHLKKIMSRLESMGVQ